MIRDLERFDLTVAQLSAIREVIADMPAGAARDAVLETLEETGEALNAHRRDLVNLLEQISPTVDTDDPRHYPDYTDYRVAEGVDVFEVDAPGDVPALAGVRWRIQPDPSEIEDVWMLLVLRDGHVENMLSITGDAINDLDLITTTYETRDADGSAV